MRQRRTNRAKDKRRHSSSQLLNFAKDSYLERTSRPVYAIVFLLPFIVFYEVGTILLNTDVLNQSQVRVVAFVWLQNLLEYLGSSGKVAWVAPPLAIIIILAGLQLASRKRWGLFRSCNCSIRSSGSILLPRRNMAIVSLAGVEVWSIRPSPSWVRSGMS